MPVQSRARHALAVLTGLWVTVGAAVPIGFGLLTVIKSRSGGTLGPELLSSPSVVLTVLAGYSIAAVIGGWAAVWMTTDRTWRLPLLLSVGHAGAWLLALAIGAVPLPAWLALALAGAGVAGSTVGVALRVRQVGRRDRVPLAG